MSVAAYNPVLHEAAADLVQWYQAETTLGRIHLGVEIDRELRTVLESAHRVLQQGTLLSEVELVVQAIELWQGVELDLAPVPSPLALAGAGSGALPPTLDAVITTPGYDLVRAVRLRLPLEALPRLQPADETLKSCFNFNWSSLPASVCLAQMTVTAAEAQRAVPGAMIVLPESFRESWDITGVLSGTAVVWSGELVPGERFLLARHVASRHGAAAIEGTRLRVELEHDALLAPGPLLGFSATAPVLPALERVALRLWRDDVLVGTGRLSQLGSGFAFCLMEQSD